MSDDGRTDGTTSAGAANSAFHDLDAYLALPRITSPALSPDGTRLVAAVSRLDTAATGFVSSVWSFDPTVVAPATRLTRGTTGESAPAFTADGDLLFLAGRADGDETADEAKRAVWLLPAGGGEARPVAKRPNGISAVLAACDAPTMLVTAATLPSAGDEATERRLRELRRDRKIAAILHDGYPVRSWDVDLGPDAPRLFLADLGPAPATLRDLTGNLGPALRDANPSIAADGTLVAVDLLVPGARGTVRRVLEVIDTADGSRARILDDPDADLSDPAIGPNGTSIAYRRETLSTPQKAPDKQLWVADIDGGRPRRLAPDWDRWPETLTWLPDGSGLLVVAHDDGRAPVFRVPVDGGPPERITADAAAYSDLRVAPDGATAYAIRAAYDIPPEIVRIDLVDGAVTTLPGPDDAESARPTDSGKPRRGRRRELPGVLREVETVTNDGHRVRSWLAVPHGASAARPAPLVLWIHGGPLGSWNTWSWRWCPWLLVARGYAVLLPDPALSTGYGQEFIERGWGAWGGPPFADLMAATDAAEKEPGIDAARTAAMGGSFGGYMANWVAGHTDRFDAIVTHASLWALDAFGPTTDFAYYWGREMTPQMVQDNSPHHHVANIRTPMLVIHGDKDYRVPVGEGLRLWYELLSASGLPAAADGSTVHRFLYYPNENHWILSPQHAKLWYRVVLAFLGEHVLGEPAEYPEELG